MWFHVEKLWIMNSTIFVDPSVAEHSSGLHCPKDALTDVFGWFLQVLLACLAFTCLIGTIMAVFLGKWKYNNSEIIL